MRERGRGREGLKDGGRDVGRERKGEGEGDRGGGGASKRQELDKHPHKNKQDAARPRNRQRRPELRPAGAVGIARHLQCDGHHERT
jgi:hypothetical protein